MEIGEPVSIDVSLPDMPSKQNAPSISGEISINSQAEAFKKAADEGIPICKKCQNKQVV